MKHSIKRGITIYSWHRQVEAGSLTWEKCIEAAVKLGCNGLELLGQLFFRYCPEALQEDIDRWEELMWKYGTKTVAHDFFVDKTLYYHRNLTIREGVDIVKRHAAFAKAIHCPIMRIGGQVEPEVFRQSIPILENYGIKMGLEIHNGSSSFILPSVQKVIEVIRQSGSKFIGIVPDISMFSLKVGYRTIKAALDRGVDKAYVNKICKIYTEVSNEEFRKICNEEMEKATDEATRAFLAMVRRTEYFDPKVLLEHMPYIIHCHGKFYEMDDNNEETTLDYPGVLKAFIEGGYNGYISAEYEGAPINGDTFEPFRRYQKMLDKYLGKYPDANYPEWPDARPAPGGGFFAPTQAAVPGTLKNHYENSECTGFELEVKNFYYRGVPLSLFESCYILVDGVRFGPKDMRVAVDGEVFKFEDMCDVTLHYWNKGFNAKIIVSKPGGLVKNKEYAVSAAVTIRSYYMREGIAGQITSPEVLFAPAIKMTVG